MTNQLFKKCLDFFWREVRVMITKKKKSSFLRFPRPKMDEETMLRDVGCKRCPYCGVWSWKEDGCNYVTCICKGGSRGQGEWCWLCAQPKYDVCNAPEHNSH
jgi:hypothetical protein